jgi:hypothetical protein
LTEVVTVVRWVAKVLLKERVHRIEHSLVEWRRGEMIDVDETHE